MVCLVARSEEILAKVGKTCQEAGTQSVVLHTVDMAGGGAAPTPVAARVRLLLAFVLPARPAVFFLLQHPLPRHAAAADPRSINKLAADLIDQQGAIDVLVNCAGDYGESGGVDVVSSRTAPRGWRGSSEKGRGRRVADQAVPLGCPCLQVDLPHALGRRLPPADRTSMPPAAGG